MLYNMSFHLKSILGGKSAERGEHEAQNDSRLDSFELDPSDERIWSVTGSAGL